MIWAGACLQMNVQEGLRRQVVELVQLPIEESDEGVPAVRLKQLLIGLALCLCPEGQQSHDCLQCRQSPVRRESGCCTAAVSRHLP